MEVVLGMLFLTFISADLRFAKRKLVWRAYNIAKVLSMSQKVDIINKKKFTAMALDKKDETFMMHIYGYH